MKLSVAFLKEQFEVYTPMRHGVNAIMHERQEF